MNGRFSRENERCAVRFAIPGKNFERSSRELAEVARRYRYTPKSERFGGCQVFDHNSDDPAQVIAKVRGPFIRLKNTRWRPVVISVQARVFTQRRMFLFLYATNISREDALLKFNGKDG